MRVINVLRNGYIGTVYNCILYFTYSGHVQECTRMCTGDDGHLCSTAQQLDALLELRTKKR